MKNLKYFILILVFLSGICDESMAEPKPGNEPTRTWVMMMPQYLFLNGFHLEFDRKINRPNQWITVAPAFYYRGQRGNWFFGNYDVLNMHGFSLSMFYSWYPFGLSEKGGIYLSTGAGVRFIRQEKSGAFWEEYEENGLTFYRYATLPYQVDIRSVTLRGVLGYKYLLDENLSIDFFIGPGLRLSKMKFPEWVDGYMGTDDIYGFAGRGVLAVAGLRLGIGW